MLSPGAPMTAPTDLPYLRAYAPALQAQAHALLAQGQLGALLRRKYPEGHAVRSDSHSTHAPMSPSARPEWGGTRMQKSPTSPPKNKVAIT